MKKILLTVTLAAFAFVTALQAGENKKSEQACDAAKAKGTSCCDKAKSACCEKEVDAKKLALSPKRAELAKK